ncbi:flagellar hook-associated protein FlgK [Maridesulfovibrio hydrothermalis]|uniref:Flagellar hook-associated protein 1 n=1 Tax=Maridesulfovibrio hydrothermalis AM13 = DSM 14728 TaxID=1121451 RepID=L0RB64_9BACT|nr:flagellar hook-associated protein FlgK [Maridesulfovibrio hydrothermalis]CCO23989.1 Flagellar hook-associated protein FlgK [Maridesulfovibrio hydrothermalis AM13 = DSM 14728]
MPGINSLMNLGTGALFASQAAIQVTGDNISNVNTEGYSRRNVRLEEGVSINWKPGQIGTGVRAAEVYRNFDQFIENSYNDKATKRERWDSLYNTLSSVESLFNESKGYGINSSLTKFFNDWQDLSQRPNDAASRQQLLNDTRNMVNSLHSMQNDLVRYQQQVEDYIKQDVGKANDIMSRIADINQQINVEQIEGQNNPNALYDERATLIRDLSKIMDTKVIDNGRGNMTITTAAGQTLVDRDRHFSLSYDGPQSQNNLKPESVFDGQAYFDGSSEFEYTVEVVTPGSVTSGAGAAQFRVSLDGGTTWLKDDDGATRLFDARPEDGSIQVDDLKIWFGTESSSSTTPTQPFTTGDKFVIVPKSALYWVQNTSTKENITPQINFAGQDNTRRLTGGSLTGYFSFRDNNVGRYKERMDAMTKEVIWQTNRIHSQGAGLKAHTSMEGTYGVRSDSTALGSGSSGLPFADKLQSGNSMMYFYDSTTGNLASSASFGPIDFSSIVPPGVENFDPDQHSLDDVATAVNATFGTYVNASIVNHKLQITAQPGYEYQMGTDTSGLYAALGLNTYFSGSAAADIEVNSKVNGDVDFVNAGHVNGAGEANSGDNFSALKIKEMSQADISITTAFDGTTSQTLIEYYDSTVAVVGADTATAKFNYNFQDTLASDLNDKQQEVSGVNIDEEMSNLIKYQHSYTAAAKLITTADQMLQVLLGLKN